MPIDSIVKNREIWGIKTVLVPYKVLHVVKYHEWMQSPELQRLTSSEPLSLEEEFEMQTTWVNDDDKCTFIILDKFMFEQSNCEVSSMIGDINLYFGDSSNCSEAELSIMIAEPAHRGSGRGKEVVQMVMLFAMEIIKVTTFVAKIKYDNYGSQQMFEKLGFKEECRSDIFQEITFILITDSEYLQFLKGSISLNYKPI